MRAVLDELAARGADSLRDHRVRYHLRQALPAILASLVLVPLGVCLVQFVQRIAGVAPWRPGAAMLLAAMALTAAGFGWLVAAWSRRQSVDRRAALGLFDQAVGAGERLVTADALLARPAPGPFAQAAIEDARWFLKPAQSATPILPPAPRPTSSLPRGMLFAGAAVALLFAALHPRGPAPSGHAGIDTADAPYRIPDLRAEVEPREPPPEDAPGQQPDRERAAERPPTKAADAAAAAEPSELPQQVVRKEGRGGAGRSAQAQGSRGDSDARGSPTQQGQPSPKPPVVRKPLPPRKKRAPKPRKEGEDDQPESRAGEESGTTAGRGSSRGSNKNAVTSDWKSKDQVTTEEDEDIEDDEEVEDEEVDSEARGGVQPNLRDRKPPVSRDLTIGFGNQPNPNANGRGGPSQPKKSRGTASLVLGVPIPDRIKGQPNPGKTKVTQERVEPRRERAPGARAEARTPRAGPTGPLARPELEPWMQTLLREWQRALRAQEKTTR